MTAQLVQHSSSTAAGGTVTYSIWVWSTVAAKQVTASAAASAHAMRAPHFTLCPAAHGTSCSIGSLPANQAFELMVTDHIRAAANAGAPITLAITVSGAALSPAEAAVTTVVGSTSQTPPSTPLPTVPTLPPVNLAPIPDATITPAGLSGLFPTVTPKASPSGKASRARKLAGVTQTSSALPFDPRLIGGQLAGLAVLAAAITMVVARLSLRTPQTSAGAKSGKDGGGAGGDKTGS